MSGMETRRTYLTPYRNMMEQLNKRLTKAADIERTGATELEAAAKLLTRVSANNPDFIAERVDELRKAAVKYTNARYHRKRCEAVIAEAEADELIL